MLYYALHVPEGAPSFTRGVVDSPPLALYFLGWGRPGDVGFVAINNAYPQSIGAAWVRLFTSRDQGYGYIDDETPELTIAVLPGFRGQGIGTYLLKKLIESSGPQFRALSLSVSEDNAAIHLYHRLGFVVVKQQGPSLTMKLLLRH
jgi:ribosomal protein S18 acetylase RimI-like enzyme